MKKPLFYSAVLICTTSLSAWAQNAPTAPVGDAPAPLSTPSFYGPLAANSNPSSFDAGPIGKIYTSGVLSGIGLAQTNHVPHDENGLLDLSNAQIMIQKTDGPVQFYVQAGEYILPALGSVYQRAGYTTDHFFGPVPIAYVKIAPTDNFSVQAGKLYTLIGTGYSGTRRTISAAVYKSTIRKALLAVHSRSPTAFIPVI